MDHFWSTITNTLRFTGVNDVAIWQDAIISSIFLGAALIPLSLFVSRKIGHFWNSQRPLNLLFKGFLRSNMQSLIFLSQLHALDNLGNLNPSPQYAIEYPLPLPNNKSNTTLVGRSNIDPVWSEGDGECLGEVFNTLGSAGKISNIQIADMLKDWARHNGPIITIGFNPKTLDLEKNCSPIFYKSKNLLAGSKGRKQKVMHLSIPKLKKALDCLLPNDAGIIQKTFIKGSGLPVFILAGLGTTGTSSAGFVLRENAVKLGKLYGDDAFCVLFYVSIARGRTSADIRGIYPKPKYWRRLLFFPTFVGYHKKKVFS